MKIPEPWGKAEVLTLDNRDLGGPHNKGKKDSYTLTESPFPHTSTAPYGQGPLCHWFLPWEKGNPRCTFSFPSTAGHFLGDPLKYHLTRITGESAELRRETKLTVTSTQILVDCILAHSSSSRDSRQRLCLSAEPMQWPHLDRSSVGSSV